MYGKASEVLEFKIRRFSDCCLLRDNLILIKGLCRSSREQVQPKPLTYSMVWKYYCAAKCASLLDYRFKTTVYFYVAVEEWTEYLIIGFTSSC